MNISKKYNEIKNGSVIGIKIKNARIVKGLFLEIAKLIKNYSKETVGAVINSQIEFSLEQTPLRGFTRFCFHFNDEHFTNEKTNKQFY